MWDSTVPMIGLAMRCDDLENLPVFALPERYGWRYFAPGDVDRWVRIERSAGEFDSDEAGVRGFRKYYPTDDFLGERMIFLTDGGVPFATATAWFGDDDRAVGRLHWVGMDEAHQGQGLSKPLVSLAMQRLRALGHRTAYLTTQTASWVAVKVYRQFGFYPDVRNAEELRGWEIASQCAGIDFLQDIPGRR